MARASPTAPSGRTGSPRFAGDDVRMPGWAGNSRDGRGARLVMRSPPSAAIASKALRPGRKISTIRALGRGRKPGIHPFFPHAALTVAGFDVPTEVDRLSAHAVR